MKNYNDKPQNDEHPSKGQNSKPEKKFFLDTQQNMPMPIYEDWIMHLLKDAISLQKIKMTSNSPHICEASGPVPGCTLL